MLPGSTILRVAVLDYKTHTHTDMDTFLKYILIFFFGIFYLIVKLATMGMKHLMPGTRPAAA